LSVLNFGKIRPVGAALTHVNRHSGGQRDWRTGGRADRQTWRS